MKKGKNIMKKKIINALELITQIATILMLLFANFAEYNLSAYYENGKHIPAKTIVVCFSKMASERLLGVIIVMGLMIINAIMCIVSILGKTNKKDSVLHSILPIIIFVFSFFFILSNLGSTECSIYPTFTVFCILMFVVILLGFIKRSNIIVPTENEKPIVPSEKSSEADELKKYKDLLDSGVITQEEFDAKKKQLLGL